jgi:cyclohexanone monooxygenase
LSVAVTDATEVDAVIVGAGFAGLYMLHRLRGLGLTARVFEAGGDVGGTWYWNRYPGARCDAESLAYSYSFSPELEQEWEWTERYATQPEILRYARHVAERFDLRRDIRFDTRVTEAHFDAVRNRWRVATDRGDRVAARFCIMATGCLSVPHVPDIPGLDAFAGRVLQASLWPHEPVGFTGERVGVIGTGSSAVQAIPLIAKEARHLTVFQRTPNFSVPARNAPLDPAWVAEFKQHYRAHRRNHKLGLGSGFGELEPLPREHGPMAESGLTLTDAEVDTILEASWQRGGARFAFAFGDALVNADVNARVAAFVHRKISGIVADPATAAALCPKSHPIGTKRICVDTDYYATFNRENVALVDLAREPMVRVTARGVDTAMRQVELDTLVLATGFDAMTGALLRIDVRVGDRALRDVWAEGPRTYLGLMVAGFPNLFTITGPGSPSVLSNMLVSIEQHVDWLAACLTHMALRGFSRIEARADAQDTWVAHVNDVAAATLFPRAGSWYLGANVPGKPRVFMPYAAGVGVYREVCERVAANGYEGFEFTQ